MQRKQNIMMYRRIVDVCMTVLLLFLMAYQVTGEVLHEWIGMVLRVIYFEMYWREHEDNDFTWKSQPKRFDKHSYRSFSERSRYPEEAYRLGKGL